MVHEFEDVISFIFIFFLCVIGICFAGIIAVMVHLNSVGDLYSNDGSNQNAKPRQ